VEATTRRDAVALGNIHSFGMPGGLLLACQTGKVL